MAQRAIREYEAKHIFHLNWRRYFPGFSDTFCAASVADGTELREQATTEEEAWLAKQPLVAKPDMVFGKRGVNGLVYYQEQNPGDVTLDRAATWIDAKRSVSTSLLGGQTGVLSRFLVEPFLAHDKEQEHYISATMEETCDVLCLSAHGGIDIESNWGQVRRLELPLDADDDQVAGLIQSHLPPALADAERFASFALGFYRLFRDLHFGYLEINPFVLTPEGVHLLDMVAKVDDTAAYLMRNRWGGEFYFPTPFGMEAPGPEERTVKALDDKSGASLKLTVLNPQGRIWTLVAGGGASVVYADTVADLVGVGELANYGEYSGNPTADETHAYTRVVLDLMTRAPDSQGRPKILLIGGAIANFTDVARTFTGIIRAFKEFHERMSQVGVLIYVRRGGPNYELGLRRIKTEADRLDLPIQVYGPETHMTDIVRLSLGAY